MQGFLLYENLLFILTSWAQTEDLHFLWASLLSVSYFALFVLLVGFMIVQKYSLTALKFLTARNMCVEGDI